MLGFKSTEKKYREKRSVAGICVIRVVTILYRIFREGILME